jgi:phenylpyruvate tautomerase PptA (4-oxalocrotonate tautomerase family)
LASVSAAHRSTWSLGLNASGGEPDADRRRAFGGRIPGAGYLISLGSMPLVEVELVADASSVAASGLAQSIADAVGRTLQSPPGHTWVRLHVLERNYYAENESNLEATELPVFVTVLKRVLPEGEALAGEMMALAGAIAEVTGRAMSCVHIEYAPAAGGRLGFGGQLVE